MSTITRTWRTRASALFAGLAFFAAGAANEARADITTITPGELAGAADRPYTGPASPILFFSGADGNPGNAEVAAAIGYSGEMFCARLNNPEGPSGTVTIGTATFHYFYDPAGQNIYWSFDANAPVLWAVSKGGPEAYAFIYTPQIILADTLLRSPGNNDDDPQGLSHFDVCLSQDQPIVVPPEISKTATGSWTRYHDWTLDKGADPTSIEMYNGDSHDVDYTLSVTKTPWGTFKVAGEITITDPNDEGFTVNSVTDTITFDADLANTEFHPALNCANVDDATDVIHHCTYELELSSKAHAFLAAGGTGVNSATASMNLDGQFYDDIGPATANFSFPADPEASFGDTLAVDDTMLPGDPDHTFTTDGEEFDYTHTFTCPDDEGDNPNTATGTFTTVGGAGGEVIANENVNVDCHVVTVTKTAFTKFDRDYSWVPDKKIVVRPDDLTEQDKTTYCSALNTGPYAGNYLCDDIVLKLQPDGVYDTVYSLDAQQSFVESGFVVHGVITVSWPTDAPDPVFNPANPTDVLTYLSAPTTISATVGACVMGSDAMTCPYEAVVSDKRSGINVASIVRPWICYNADESVKACNPLGSSTYEGSAPFNFDDAVVTETDKCVLMSDLFNDGGLNLGPSFEWEVGEVCEDTTTYVTGDINPDPLVFNFLDIHADWAPTVNDVLQCRFVVPNLLTLTIIDSGSQLSDDANITVDACDVGCTFTQGYWKTHAIYAPKPQFAKKRDATWDMVGAQAENTTFFLSGTTWINVFHTPPKGNVYYNLAHQYMAAKLNVYGGASVPASVATAIANAEAWFALYPPSHSFWKTNKAQATSAAGVLGSYNEGTTGPGHCAEAPLRQLILSK